MTTYAICGKGSCCPVVEVSEDRVTIGEEGNMVELKKDEWDTLVGKIKSGEIK
jgi:hypothetical protein